ncbi:S8 family serine peptidase [Bradyrhizobium sp. 2TAF24]|uniref:S8 family serine peptidase n=1 Tax=Bradyrhizobium sp. 2TAF24 TaxID=3233011 RepID=UPI003F8F1D42
MAGRSLTSGEITLLYSVYGNSLDYAAVRVSSGGVGSDIAITHNNNISFPSSLYQDDFSRAGLDFKAWFVHEAAHVWQHQVQGLDTYAEGLKLIMQFGTSYIPNAYYYSLNSAQSFGSLNIEQQAQVIQDRWLVQNGLPPRGDIDLRSGATSPTVEQFNSAFSGALRQFDANRSYSPLVPNVSLSGSTKFVQGQKQFTYTVGANDPSVITDLAQAFGISPYELLAANPSLWGANNVSPGQTLTLPDNLSILAGDMLETQGGTFTASQWQSQVAAIKNNWGAAFGQYLGKIDFSQVLSLSLNAGVGTLPAGAVTLFVGKDGSVLYRSLPGAENGVVGIYGLSNQPGLRFNNGEGDGVSTIKAVPGGGIELDYSQGGSRKFTYDVTTGLTMQTASADPQDAPISLIKYTTTVTGIDTNGPLDPHEGIVAATFSNGSVVSFSDWTTFESYRNLLFGKVIAAPVSSISIDTAGLLGLISSNGFVSSPSPSVPLNNGLLSAEVQQLAQVGQMSFGSGGDGTPFSGNNVIYAIGGVIISAAGQAGTDLASLSSSSIANALYRPYYQSILSSFNNIPAATDWLNTSAGSTTLPGSQVPYWALTGSNIWTNPTPSFTDPLLIDLTGAGIGVSSWIKSPVYFDTNVIPDANGNPTTTPDGLQHQTAWMQGGTAMLVFEASGIVKPITNITQTVSQFLNAGPTPAKYVDGLGALASLVKTDPTTGKPYTVFSAQTAAIDSATGVSYWNEIMVWNDANHNGVSDSGEIVSLASLGIASIGLQGSGNFGENINGSVVTNRTTYTRSDGTTGQAAAVNFQNNSIGATVSTGSGGEIVTSLSEGGPTRATTFVAENSSGHSYTIQGGKLTDTTTGQVVVVSGITAALSSNQNDVITVAASDTGTYWLGGGTGADTLTGGGGTNVFLVNPTTVVHGGTGANSFNIAKVVGTQGVTIDMAKANLQEVIGGAGGDIINASGTTWNVFIQAGSGNSIIIGGAASAAISGGTGDDLIELGAGGGVVHAGRGNDVIYGGSGLSAATQPSYVNAGASSNAAYVERLFNGVLGREADLASFTADVAGLNNGSLTQTSLAAAILSSMAGQALFGSLNNTQFTNAIFQGLLGRAPNATELNSFVSALNAGQTRDVALQTVAASPQSQTYWGAKHPGASDVIFAGPGNDIVMLGTNNAEVYAGTGKLTVIGNANGFSVVGFHGSYADYSVAQNADGTITVTNINNMDGDGTVTMKNVTDLDFKDISQVPLASTAGMPVSDRLYTANTSQVTTNASGQWVIAASTLLANDIDYAGNPLSIRELLDNNGNAIARGASGQVNGGTVALSSDGATITFTPGAGYSGVPSFRYHIQDNKGNNGAIVQQVGTANTAEMTGAVYINTPDMPTDTLFDSEWYLPATNVLAAWRDYTGAGVNVAVFDPSGNVNFANPDLASNAGTSTRLDGSPGVEQLGTHATLVAGVIGAARDGSGAVGVAYNATIHSVALPTDATQNLNNLRLWKNYDVVNNSWGFSPAFVDNFIGNASYKQAFVDAVTQGRQGLGTVLVFAGGNDRAKGRSAEDINETNSRYGITVGGINAATNLGSLVISGLPFSEAGASILVSAPANNVTSTGVTYTNDFGQQFGANYQTTQGTSFATPIVSGVVALMLQANPSLGYRDIQQILAYSAVKVDPNSATWSFNGATNWNGGGLHTSEDYGYGEVDAHAAVRLAATWQTVNIAGNEQSLNVQQGKFSTSASTATPLNYVIPVDQGASTPAINLTFASGVRVEHVDVELNLVGVRMSDLIVKLIAPSGETSTLINREGNTTGQQGTDAPQNLDFTFDTVKDWGELSGGTWKLQVCYAAGTTPVGTLAGVNATIYGSSTSSATPQTFIYTDEYAQLAGGSRSILQEPNGTADIINLAATTGALNLNLAAGSTDSTIGGKALTIAAGTHVDWVYLGDGTSIVHGNADADTFVAGTGNDTIYGGSATNTFFAGGTNGLPRKVGSDTFIGGGSSNVFYLGDGAATVVGSAIGNNTVDFSWASSAVVINLATGINGGAAARDTITNVQSIVGSSHGDTISAWGGKTLRGGTANNNTLDYSAAPSSVTVDFLNGAATVGSLASDTISGFQRVIGSAGNDTFVDGQGLTYVDGGGGYNTLNFFSNPNGVTLNLAAGTGTSGFGDTMVIKNIHTIYGSLYHLNTIIGAYDTQYIVGSMYGGDRITANSANTEVAFVTSASAVIVNLTTGVNTGGAAQGDILTNVVQVQGSSYNDTLTGNGSFSMLDGYLGNDTLIGGGGYDVYVLGANYGQDVVFNGTGSGAASGEITVGAPPSGVWLSRSGSDLVVQMLGTSTRMTVKSWYTTTSAQLQWIVASDGSQISTSAIGQLQAAMASYQASNPTFNPQTATAMPAALQGSVASLWGPGVLTGTGGKDTLDPGIGNTTLVGNGGSDTYQWRSGYGADVIINGVATNTGPSGQLQLSAGLDPRNLWFTRSGYDLVIQVINQPAQMTVRGWFANGYSQLSSLVLADGSQIGTAAVSALATAMTAFQNSSGFNPLTAIAMPTASAVQAALTANWSRTISSAASNTTLSGIYGSDTLIASGANSTLIGGSGLSTLVSNAGGNTLVAGSGPAIADYVGIANLTVNLATGKAAVNGASASDTLIGIASAMASGAGDTLIAGAVAGTLVATGASDTLVGNALGSSLQASQSSSVAWYTGNYETINLGTGTARMAGATVGDTLIGLTNAKVSGVGSTLIAGSGVNTLIASGTSDVYQFARGNGQAIIVNGASTNVSASNELDFAAGITDQQLWFVRSNNDLQIDLMGTSSQVMVAGWFNASSSQLSEITAGGLKLDSQVSQLVQAMATYSANNAAFNPTAVAQAPNDAALQTAIAAAWHS